MNSKNYSNAPTSPPGTLNSVTLRVHGMGHVPAIKNSMFAIVKKENRQWKKKCVQLLASQLLSISKTTESGILTPQYLRYLMSALPFDDSWKDIPELHVKCEKVDKGNAGATILIERI